MNILYVTTILSIYILFMIIHKTEKKQNLITWLTISTVLILCYNVLICTILSFIGILCTLPNLSIINAITVIGLVAVLLKSKKMQKYYVKSVDIIFSVLLLIIVVVIAYNQYGFPFNVKYYSTDGSSHYLFAEQFYKNSQLLDKGEHEDEFGMYNPEYRLPGAYVNEGILFKVFDGLVLKIDLFIIFDLIVIYMSGILFYSLLQKYANESKKIIVIAIYFSLIYMLGYQLNSMIQGFVYLSLALDVVITLILLVSNYEKEEISTPIILPILSLLSFGVFFSYGYFVPLVYIGLIVNLIVKTIKDKEEVTSIKNIIKIIIVVVVPLILGMIYFMLLPAMNGRASEIDTIGRDGGIYKNYITNLLIFIPILITGLILKIKNRDKNLEFGTILFILSILFLVILLIGRQFEIVSNYYYFKAYYIIWPLAIYNTFLALSYILKQNNKKLRIATYVYISIYLISLLIPCVFNKNIGINDIFYKNREIISKENYTILNRGEAIVLERAGDSIENDHIYVVSTQKDIIRRWMYVLCKSPNIFEDYFLNNQGDIERWLRFEEKYYLALYKNYNKLEKDQEPDANSDKYKIIYKDENCFILERK